jgi:hypothetical protein
LTVTVQLKLVVWTSWMLTLKLVLFGIAPAAALGDLEFCCRTLRSPWMAPRTCPASPPLAAIWIQLAVVPAAPIDATVVVGSQTSQEAVRPFAIGPPGVQESAAPDVSRSFWTRSQSVI